MPPMFRHTFSRLSLDDFSADRRWLATALVMHHTTSMREEVAAGIVRNDSARIVSTVVGHSRSPRQRRTGAMRHDARRATSFGRGEHQTSTSFHHYQPQCSPMTPPSGLSGLAHARVSADAGLHCLRLFLILDKCRCHLYFLGPSHARYARWSSSRHFSSRL